MGLATKTPPSSSSPSQAVILKRVGVGCGAVVVVGEDNSRGNSMSQGFHQGIFSFSDGFERTTSTASQEEQQQQQQHHIAQQSRRDKMRVQGFDPSGHHALVDEPGGIYDAASGAGNMLTEMFNFPTAAGPSASELLASQMQQGGYRLPSRPVVGFGSSGDWSYDGSRQGGGMVLDGKQLNADSAAVMQLFLMNPQQQQAQQRSPSPPPPPSHQGLFLQAAAGPSFGHDHQATSLMSSASAAAGGFVEGQGLSLSLSSSLQQFEMAKAAAASASDHHHNLHHNNQELRVRDGVLYFNTAASSSSNNNHQTLHLQQAAAAAAAAQGQQSHQHIHMGYGGASASTVGVLNVLRNSKYSRPAQELLEEFCSVGRGQFKRSSTRAAAVANPNPNAASTSAAAGGSSSSVAKDAPALSPADRFEHQRKKSKLLSMLDEVDRRYNHYCDQMQIVVNSFDSVMDYGAATPYTAMAQKAMSRHFRCLKDAIADQLKRTCEALGEKEAGSISGITKGETPRLRVLDQSLRQQRAFHQMGMMEQEAWRPQRGLPERSVTILRAWLFEHFLHPYPSDADKHLLARQTGLSRNQVSNWFINARVRLWKPMVEEMYQQESKDEGDPTTTTTAAAAAQQQQQQQQQQRDDAAAAVAGTSNQTPQSQSPYHHQNQQHQHHQQQQNPQGARQAPETDNSQLLHALQQPGSTSGAAAAGGSGGDVVLPSLIDNPELYREYGGSGLGPAAAMRLGTAGDVSLTLGLRHAGNAPEKNRPFSIRDFGGC